MDLLVPFLVLAVAPGLFWLWYFYHRDKYEPEPLSWIAIVYLLGMTITIPVAFIEGTIALLVGDFLIAIAVAPVVEEYAKYLVVRSTVYQSVEFNEPMDGIVYSTAVGLGFATLENIIYVFTSLATSPEFALQTGVIRALLSVPGHALFSSMWGYALGQAKFMAPSARPAIIVGGLIAAMISHSIFNLLLFSDIGVAVLVLVFFPFIWWVVLRHIKKALAQSPFNHNPRP